VIVVWECELRELDHIASRLAYEIRGKEGKISY
jgi:G:T-mismatch repair DNA endonuclease (very short patch repair protein)